MVERLNMRMTRERKRRISSSPANTPCSSESKSKRGRFSSELLSGRKDGHDRGDNISNGVHGNIEGRREPNSRNTGRLSRRDPHKERTSQTSDGSRRQEGYRRCLDHRRERRRRSDSSSLVRTAKQEEKNWDDSKHFKDDREGHLIFNRGDVIQARYKLLQKLGEGAFGQVVHCHDKDRDNKVALKIIKNIGRYRDAAELEINVLKRILKEDPDGTKSLCVRMLDWFDFHGHVCISFDVLGLSIYDYMRENEYAPYYFEEVQEISYQLCQAVSFLHDMQLTHTDLKPENILLVNSDFDLVTSSSGCVRRRLRSRQIRLIDFGSATFDHEHHSRIVSTRHYRAPEVLLQLGWSQPCDVWSVGCIMFELYAGDTLFQTHDNIEHLRMMERILGKIPKRMVKQTPKSYFERGVLGCSSRMHRYVDENCRPLDEYRKSDSECHLDLFNLIGKMLEYDPRYRIRLCRALEHPLFEKLAIKNK